ncbi:hypothetical protein ACFOFO_10145 [Undibacterium arcticum]|uniref:Uncharacterized protein n=1 Tax=Undibacterium arcticum TaxID=1762892 RepID=A0ABV7F398_9BURK
MPMPLVKQAALKIQAPVFILTRSDLQCPNRASAARLRSLSRARYSSAPQRYATAMQTQPENESTEFLGISTNLMFDCVNGSAPLAGRVIACKR